jgi:hypothetical protein
MGNFLNIVFMQNCFTKLEVRVKMFMTEFVCVMLCVGVGTGYAVTL